MTLLRPLTEADLAAEADFFARLEMEDYAACRRSFYRFVQAAWPIIEPGVPFQGRWYHRVICRALEADDEAAERAYRNGWQAAMRACLETGATISHHHGIGLQRAPWMEAEHGTGLDVLRRVKHALDPAGIMNPGKLGLGSEPPT